MLDNFVVFISIIMPHISIAELAAICILIFYICHLSAGISGFQLDFDSNWCAAFSNLHSMDPLAHGPSVDQGQEIVTRQQALFFHY